MTEKDDTTKQYRIWYTKIGHIDSNSLISSLHSVTLEDINDANEALQGFWVSSSLKYIRKVYDSFGCVEAPKGAKFYIPASKIEYIEVLDV